MPGPQPSHKRAVSGMPRAGHVRPLRSRLRASLRRGRRPRRPAVQAVVCGQCVGEEFIPPGVFAAAQGSRAACMPPLRANPLTSAYPAERSRPLGGAQRAPPASKAGPLMRLFAPQGQTLFAPRFRSAQPWPHAHNPAVPGPYSAAQIPQILQKIQNFPRKKAQNPLTRLL